MSNFSSHHHHSNMPSSFETNDNPLQTSYNMLPHRQPRGPPENEFTQRHEGFLRFLKQHASPPHNRVTAGGRIVPTGPFTPPPMFDYASLTGLIHDQRESSDLTLNARFGNVKRFMRDDRTGNQAWQNTASRGFNRPGHANPGAATFVPPSFASNNISYLMPGNQTNQVLPIGQLSDGTPVVSCNGFCYRAAWDNDKILLEPLQVNIASPHPLPQNQKLGQNPHITSAVPENFESTTASVPTSLGDTYGGIAEHGSVPNEQALRAELTELNSHLAFYHYDIRPLERAALVARRRALIEEIDKIRVPKAPTIVSMPYKHTSQSGEKVQQARDTARSVPSDENRDPYRTSVRSEASKRGLSPNAPAFVPGRRGFSKSAQDDNQKRDDNTSSQVATKTPERRSQIQTSSTGSSQQYSPLDPKDPAMRMVHQEDIRYTAEYASRGMDTKYCNTVSQFQEAIRRVREQARLYGCEGGSSKDPAYDAEQDLWWAIKDQSPIPLPSKTPDHVAFPRPWNWNNSAFNFQAARWSSPLLESHHLASRSHPRDASNDQGTNANSAQYCPGFYGQTFPHNADSGVQSLACASDNLSSFVQPDTAFSAINIDSAGDSYDVQSNFTRRNQVSGQNCTETLKSPSVIQHADSNARLVMTENCTSREAQGKLGYNNRDPLAFNYANTSLRAPPDRHVFSVNQLPKSKDYTMTSLPAIFSKAAASTHSSQSPTSAVMPSTKISIDTPSIHKFTCVTEDSHHLSHAQRFHEQ